MFDDFLQGSSLQPLNHSPQPFAMDMMRTELDHVHRASTPTYNFVSGPMSHMTEQRLDNSSGLSPADFAMFQQRSDPAQSARSVTPLAQTPIYQPSMGSTYGGMNMGMNMGMMSSNYMPSAQNFHSQVPMIDKGKSRMVELDDKEWESQFAQLDVHHDAATATATATSTENATETNHLGDFESIWRGIQAENAQNAEPTHLNDIDIDRWKDFDALANSDNAIGTYLFERDNPFKDSSLNAFEEGQKILAEGGNLSLAALAFETAVQRDPTHVAAWVALGQSQAQNEKETPAVRALEQALKLDPASLEAMMALAVSYTNEGYESSAFRTLERWVTTKYPDLASQPSTSDSDSTSTWSWMDRAAQCERVTNLFILAAQKSPSGPTLDPDVQVGLGVLFYGAEEYGKAVDCFGAALASSQTGVSNSSNQVHLLWNRLGATLANSGRSEEALDAYERALALRPNFVRARYNLGVSCVNMGCYDQAATHLIGALKMHRVVEAEGLERMRRVVGDGPHEGGRDGAARLESMIRQNESTNLFDTLRRVFAQMGRRDLVELVGPGMDLEGWKERGHLVD